MSKSRIMPFNSFHTQPSYRDMEKTRPQAKMPRENRNIKAKQLPIKIIGCSRCSRTDNPLINGLNITPIIKGYIHKECLTEEEKINERN